MIQNDFYHYINHEWLDRTEIPDEYQRWSVFNELNDVNIERLKTILSSNDTYDSNFSKLLVLHEQYLSRPKEFTLTEELKTILDKLNSFTTKQELMKFVWENFNMFDISTPLNLSVYSDYNNANFNILHLSGGGLGLMDRDYYFEDEHAGIREKYKQFMKTFLSLIPEYEIEPDTVYYIEETLARHTYTNVQRRDPHLRNNVMNIEMLETLYPNLYLRQMLELLNVQHNVEHNDINVSNPSYLKNLDDMWKIITVKRWKQYLMYLYFRKVASLYSKHAEEILFEFYAKELSGVIKMKPEWKRAIEFVEGKAGMLLSKEYVKRYFPEESKEQVTLMIKYIKDELEDRIKNNKWMKDSTKEYALVKLSKMNFKIGYPDKWIDFSGMIISSDNSLFQNVMNVYSFEHDFEFSQLYKNIDRTLWFMCPHEINAYYSPSYNEIVFPAGILSDPFFGDNMARNFGGIGMVIGHEITHGFDDQGRKYDADGNLNEWWDSSDLERFNIEARKMSEQFNKLTIEGKNINGDLTLGENIADLGGIIISYNAMQRYIQATGNTLDVKEFFYNYANIWRCKTRREDTLRRLVIDPHSPPCYRVNQILSNMNEFYDIFNITKSDGMYMSPEDRVVIW
jgi:putative endopeptidase